MNSGKVLISFDIEVFTGLHIGGSQAYSAIGYVDSPVIKDHLTGLPLLPGSSLKGKLRSLLAKRYNDRFTESHNDDHECILRLFGSQSQASRMLVSDSVMTEEERDRLLTLGAETITEVKFENTINRLTAIANPRQIERVIRGSIFNVEIIYEVCEPEEGIEDLDLLKEGLDLLAYDYLGGHGSRGYGRVGVKNLEITALTEGIPDGFVEEVKLRWLNG